MNKILIISACKEKMHELEFVRPIEKIVGECDIKNFIEVDLEVANKYSHIIISGTSLQDDSFLKSLDKFDWLKDFGGKVLGICAGFQILGLVFGGVQNKETEIGYYFENFDKTFLGLEGKHEVYHLHNNKVNFSEDFEVYSSSEEGVIQAVKHKEKDFYGVLFHPEVRNKKLIEGFIDG